jgi:multidrug efflux pump subunit AcrB
MKKSIQTGFIAWFADNPVAANLFMLALLIGGFLGFQDTNQEVYPDFNLNKIHIQVVYPDASPEAIEQGILLAAEKALTGLNGISRITSKATEGNAQIQAELQQQADPTQVLQDIRNAISRITTFPEGIEPPHIYLGQHDFHVISLGIAADFEPQALYQLGERIRRQLANIPGVARIDVLGGFAPQISIEVSQQTLQQYQLDLRRIAAQIRQHTQDLPAGRIQTEQGELLLRIQGQREKALDFADIPIKTRTDGSQLLLSDIAGLRETFADPDQIFEFNGHPGIRLDLYQTRDQNPTQLTARIREQVQRLNAELPDAVTISVQNDRSKRYAERRDILLKNGLLGLLLVVIVLGAFLNPRLAFWVAVSIPVVFIGSFSLLPYVGVSLNMISMFAFILTIGIVVDDAIIVGENIHAKMQQGMPVKAAIREGVAEMTVPVIYAVGTNIIAFAPLLLVPGATGQFLRDMPLVIAIVFAISLIEALLILPSHLHFRECPIYRPFARIQRFHEAMTHNLDALRQGPFRRWLQWAIGERYLTLTIFGGLLALIIAWYAAGHIDLTWRPEIPGDRVDAEIEMPVDASLSQTLAAVRKVEAAGLAAIEELGGRQYLQHWFTRAGWRRPTYGDVNMYLAPDNERPFTQEAFTREWRKQLGELPEAKSVFFEYLIGPGGNKSLQIHLSHPNSRILAQNAQTLAQQITALPGVVDVNDGVAQGKRQIRLQLTPEGRLSGLDETTLGQQIRAAFHGVEVQRLLRDGQEIKVVTRLPKAESISALHQLILNTPDGGHIPLMQAAELIPARADSTINREDGRRILKISASIDKKNANTRRIRAQIEETIMPELLARHSGLQWQFAGGRRDRNSTLQAIFNDLLWASLIIYGLLAALFRSYIQGLIVMTTIPFAVAASIAGHIALGHDLSAVSVYGMIALSGLVINNALVLTLRYNQLNLSSTASQSDIQQAILSAATSRFRPILLTTLTTMAGLLPMLFETSIQARFLAPMAIALTFGVAVTFFVVLFFIPALLAVTEDCRRLMQPDQPH